MQGEMRAIIVVEILPSRELCMEINVIRVGQQLIQLGLVGSVRPFDFPVELRGSGQQGDVRHNQTQIWKTAIQLLDHRFKHKVATVFVDEDDLAKTLFVQRSDDIPQDCG